MQSYNLKKKKSKLRGLEEACLKNVCEICSPNVLHSLQPYYLIFNFSKTPSFRNMQISLTSFL